jgi:hypothetical protein
VKHSRQTLEKFGRTDKVVVGQLGQEELSHKNVEIGALGTFG